MNKLPTLAIVATVVYAAAGLTVACVDMRDYKTVPPTPPPAGVEVVTPDEPETINEAKRSLEDFRNSANTYIERRNQDIAKEERKVAFIEGGLTSGLASISPLAGPLAPLVTLVAGYAIRRRNDKTPQQVQKEKEQSYAKARKDVIADIEAARKAGVSFGDAISKAISDVE